MRPATRWTAAATERREIVAGCFARLFGPEAADPVHYVDQAWAAEEWSRGCYGGFMPPGAWSDNGPALREPVGPIHWAGAETATVWNGYMDGAVGSGREAAGADRRPARLTGYVAGHVGTTESPPGREHRLSGTMDFTPNVCISPPCLLRRRPTAAPRDRS